MLIKKDLETFKSYLEDSSGLRGGFCEEIVIPESYKEITEFFKGASEKKNPVTVSGGGTGVTGGRIPFGGSVLSTEKLNKIIDLRPGKIVVQSGVRIEEIYKAAKEIGYFYPPDPTEQTSFIGGNISTNASGARSFKYGSTRNFVTAIKFALTSGKILDIKRGKIYAQGNTFNIPDSGITLILPYYRSPKIKNSAGYFCQDGMDLIDLFVGHEGTLGVVLEAELLLHKKEKEIFSAFVFFNTQKDALSFVKIAKEKKKSKAVDLQSLEFFDENSLSLLRKKYPQTPKGARSLIFFEEEFDPKQDVLEKWFAILEPFNIPESNIWIAEEETKIAFLKEFRHSLPELINEIVNKRGIPKLGTDFAVPDRSFEEIFNTYITTLRNNGLDHYIFGHIGDNHLHVNILPKNKGEIDEIKEIYEKFATKAIELKGTVSAEHGIGKLKHKFLELMYGKAAIQEMISIKKSFDPSKILGLDNIFSKDLLL